MGTLKAAKMVAHKWLCVLADQVGTSHRFAYAGQAGGHHADGDALHSQS